jgi:hypothetical protein
VDKSLEFLRREDGLDVYFNKLTGKEVYIGRTGETLDGEPIKGVSDVRIVAKPMKK